MKHNKGRAKDNQNKIIIANPTIENRNSICPVDYCQLVFVKVLPVYNNGSIERVKAKRCPICRRNYISVKHFSDMSTIGIGNRNYYNLNLDKNTIRTKIVLPKEETDRINKVIAEVLQERKQTANASVKRIPPKSSEGETTTKAAKVPQTITKDTAKGYVVSRKLQAYRKCVVAGCEGQLINVKVQYKNPKGNNVISSAKRCPKCGKYYIALSKYTQNKDIMTCLNEGDALEPILSEEERQEQLEKRNRLLRVLQESENRMIKEQQLRVMRSYEKIKTAASKEKGKSREEELNIKDFLIRKNTFNCAYKEHKLKDITANVAVLNRDGKHEIVEVPAGYCKQCNVYFILDDSYKTIKSRGIPLCKVYDWKTIEMSESTKRMDLAQESLLHHYGYNVNASENLSSERRRQILQILIDNQVMTKSEIISYLDFFIAQRKGNKAMEAAVEKWESDKAFVQGYKKASLQNYGIRSLKK